MLFEKMLIFMDGKGLSKKESLSKHFVMLPPRKVGTFAVSQ